MKASEFLVDAKRHIDSPEKWTQGFFAADNRGQEVSYASMHATCFCSLGALRLSAYRHKDTWGDLNLNTISREYLRSAVEVCHQGFSSIISDFNDCHTHEEVMEVWDLAIKLALADEEGSL